jgi:hypothetical protein
LCFGIKKMKKAFTIIELVAAIALMVMVVSFAGLIFRVSIDAQRTTAANAEIMRKLRSITDQLNTDFRGIRKDAPLLIFFHQDAGERFDQIMFFADGDFQSTQLYDFDPVLGKKVPSPTGEPICGNVARIDYGLAQSLDPNIIPHNMTDPWLLGERYRLLGCRRHILANPDFSTWLSANYAAETLDFNSDLNERYEHDNLSLAQWKTLDGTTYSHPPPPVIVQPPQVDMTDPNTYHKLVCEGVSSFAIQWPYWDSGMLRWFASNDPDGNGDPADSHFAIIASDTFGAYFNIPGSGSITGWYSNKDATVQDHLSGSYPKALKFTFTIHDSKGIIEGGRRFTHIVYLGD